MRRNVGIVCSAVIAVVAMFIAVPAASAAETYCVGVLAPGTYQSVVVPQGGSCTTSGPTTVKGDVQVLEDASFTSVNPPSVLIVRGSVRGRAGSQINIDSATLGSVDVHRGGLILSNSTVEGNIQSHDGTSAFINGVSVTKGSIDIKKISGPNAMVWIAFNSVERGNVQAKDNLISTPDCAVPGVCFDIEGNTVSKGNIEVEKNQVSVDNFLDILSNAVGGNLLVNENSGDAIKEVFDNTVGGNLTCRRNQEPFVGGPNAARRAPGHDNQCFITEP